MKRALPPRKLTENIRQVVVLAQELLRDVNIAMDELAPLATNLT